MVLVAIETSPVGSEPPAAVGERISKDGRHDLGASAVFDHDVIPAREIGRFGHHAKTGRDLRPVLNTLRSTTIPVLHLNCCGGALLALASLRVCGPACLHGETWLPSVMF